MRSLLLAGLLAATLVTAQKIEVQTLDPRKIVRVETAKDHLTVIEVADPVSMVAVGNPGAFTVERRENKVFIKPVEDDARTNLFIWTSAGRYAYELIPASAVEQMHFLIEQAAVRRETPKVAQKAAPLPVEMLTQAKPILVYGERETHGRVEVTLRDLYQNRDRIYLRYAFVNHSGKTYRTGATGRLAAHGCAVPRIACPTPGSPARRATEPGD